MFRFVCVAFCFLLVWFGLLCFVLVCFSFCRLKNLETTMWNSASSAWFSLAAWRDLLAYYTYDIHAVLYSYNKGKNRF